MYNLFNSFITAIKIKFFARRQKYFWEDMFRHWVFAFKGSIDILRSSFVLAVVFSLLFVMKYSNHAYLIGLWKQ